MIRSLPNMQRTKIIILSGRSQSELLPLLQSGADAIIEKPVESDILIEKIELLFSQTQ
jgi:DNA-binding response OmpR family regulator